MYTVNTPNPKSDDLTSKDFPNDDTMFCKINQSNSFSSNLCYSLSSPFSPCHLREDD